MPLLSEKRKLVLVGIRKEIPTVHAMIFASRRETFLI